jgi:DNA helicase-2/ATP-dependent DNA helicase PcrA
LLESARRTAALSAGRAAKAIAGFLGLLDRLQQTVLHFAPPAAVEEILEEIGYLQLLRADGTDEALGRIENLEALIRLTAEIDAEITAETPDLPPVERLMRFLDEACLASEADNLPDDDGRVTLLTGHLAKGLEFPVVFVAGLCEGAFPHARSLDTQKDIEEERRLAYVAFTRARERLYLCRSQRRFVRGANGAGWIDAAPSRFLLELPEEALTGDLVLRRGARGQARTSRHDSGSDAGMNEKMAAFLSRMRASEQQGAPATPLVETTIEPESHDIFQSGCRVRHPVFGLGIIRNRDSAGPQAKLLIHFSRFGPKKLRLGTARLELVVE